MERSYPVDGPLDLGMTLRGMSMWGTATWVRVDDSGVWYARRTPDGPGTVHIRVHGGGLVARAFGDGAAHLLDDVPGLCGLGNQGIGALGPACEVVHELKKRSLGYRTPRSGQVFPQLVSTALAQKVTGQNSAGAVRRIARAWGERAPGPRDDLWLLPLPRELERRPPEAYVPMGVERRRADLVRRIASRWSALEKAARMPGPEARAHLEKLPGIGPWTSGVVVGGPLGDPDAVPIGDYHLPDWVTWNLARRPRGDDDTMMRLLEPYAGLRGMVARMITMRGSPPPRWGPRTTPRDIREPW